MIFVMAASGEVGRNVVNDLLMQGVAPGDVLAGGRDLRKLEALAKSGVQTRPADYNDASGMQAAFRGAETLILIPTKTPAAPRCLEHFNALSAAKAAGVGRVVFLSIQAATPGSRFLVAPFILFAECATRQTFADWTIARMSLYTDPLAEWAPALARTGRLPYPVKEARIAYIARADVSRSLAAIGRRRDLSGQIVELTGPAALSMPELAGELSAATGKNIIFTSVSDAEYREICRKDNQPEDITDILATMYQAAEAQEFSNVTDDVDRVTGTPPETVEETLSRLLGV